MSGNYTRLGHVQLGIGEFAKAAQTANTQGLDFYSVADDRLAQGFEYTARFMLGEHIDLFGVLQIEITINSGIFMNPYIIIIKCKRCNIAIY